VLVAQTNPFQKIDHAGRDVTGAREGGSILPLRMQGAVAKIRGKVLVGPVDLTISEQGFTIVMGPNGAGKTTLLRLMHGLQRLSAGALVWNRPRAVVLDRQAFVFQSPIMMRRSVLDNIAYPLMLHGLNKGEARTRAQRIAVAFGLGDLLEQPAPVLSGGEKQKLSLARALIREPEILFLDEPCANLDGRATREIEAILKTAQNAGTRIVMSTHNMGQARRLAQDVVFMYGGKVHECAERDAQNPRSGGVCERGHRRMMLRGLLAGLTSIALTLGTPAQAEKIRLAVTTSFDNSGLAAVLLPRIREDIGLEVQLIVVGTGQALRLGAAGDVDAILVHSRAAEQAFVATGHGLYRRQIMSNDFVLIGPKGDPAGISGAKTAAQALGIIAASRQAFVSRGDDSGTHKMELALWDVAGIDVSGLKAGWYRAAGASMGGTLNTASGMNAYVMSDRASWLNFGNKGDLALLFAGDPLLFNQYTFIPVDPREHPHVKRSEARALEDWLVSDTARGLIDGYRINGERLFTFNAKASGQ